MLRNLILKSARLVPAPKGPQSKLCRGHGFAKMPAAWSGKVCFFAVFLTFAFSACAQSQIRAPAEPYFYQGLLSRDGLPGNPTGREDAARSFERAIHGPNLYIRQAAAAEIGRLMLEGMEFSEETVAAVRQEAAGSWALAFAALGGGGQGVPDRDAALELLLNASSSREASLFALRGIRSRDADFFSPTENALIEARLASDVFYWRGALRFFRDALQSGDEARDLIFQFPDLIEDLSRAYQFADTTAEGITLFLDWEGSVPAGHAQADQLRHRLPFWAGRIARQRGNVEQGIELFERGLLFAQSAHQTDLSAWNILDLAVRVDRDYFLGHLERLAGLMDNVVYLDLKLDRFSRELLLSYDWDNLIRAFAAIKNLENSISTSRYGWLLARAIEEGFLSQAQLQRAAVAINAPADAGLAGAYKLFVYNNGCDVFIIRFVSAAYYRALSAESLGKVFLDVPPAARPVSGEPSPAFDFFLGFFENGAARFVPRFMAGMEGIEDKLSTEELRAIAGSLKEAGYFAYAMRLASAYTRRPGHVLSREDIEFLYPAPYRGIIDHFAVEHDIDVSVFYGLIRTESAFLSAVASHAGAVGLSQLMPATAADIANRLIRAGGPDYFYRGGASATLDLTDPELNVHIGAFYLRHLITDRFDDDLLLALLAYNAGQGRVRRWRTESSLPTDLLMEIVPFRETREYGRRVLGAAAIYRALFFY
ncbi:MAG: lytic transglycosylase domain-containing protein [Spirochaetes bacterium]|nr:lytic transglycosylase domain-containing protein [Spirochaetota bacterium]